ncbi:MAG TPA: N(4)-(beta-N-acetylglucosaminyl)-L-asparaginase [Terriglobales bacterium]|nr:N(4)-(beta-N-acetylglucosaminyl)-L-asparaginase [Terriglobales bacterium]
MGLSRREFLTTAGFGSLVLGLDAGSAGEASAPQATSAKPKRAAILISSANGINGIDQGWQILSQGGDTLDAAIAVGKVQEDDPNDDSVGLGGLPNEEGVVELDASCMHGPTRRAGAVGGVRNIKNVSLLAKAVMEHSGHVMLVGDGAERFAVAMGFPRENLLTERSRKIWLLWKESNPKHDWWGPGLADPDYKISPDIPSMPPPLAEIAPPQLERLLERLLQRAAALGIEPQFRMTAVREVLYPPSGTIHVSALNEKGEISGMTTTSGLAWKIPGRVGDSPIVGAGCYTDQDVGSAGATGNGEENIKVAGAHSIVESMRHGMSPREAGLETLKRIARNYQSNPRRLRYVSMRYYILRNDGEYAGVSLWSGPADHPAKFAVHDGSKRLENCVALFQGEPLPFPPQAKNPFARPVP